MEAKSPRGRFTGAGDETTQLRSQLGQGGVFSATA
jgi:hypothetical protein